MVFSHNGKIGDLIYCLCSIYAVGGSHEVFLKETPGQFNPADVEELVDNQPYLSVCRDESRVDVNMEGWRNHLSGQNLVTAQSTLLGIRLGRDVMPDVDTPWLDVGTHPKVADVAICLTKRYRCGLDWVKIRDERLCGRSIVFVGLPEEVSNVPFGVERVETTSLLEAACALSGVDEVWCNPGGLHAIAEGLGKKVLLEDGSWTVQFGRAKTELLR